MMTLKEARERNLDCYFFMKPEVRTEFLRTFHEVTGRETFEFEEVYKGFTLLVGAVTPRPRPVVRIVE
jgi:hypothetical protein